MPDKVAAGQLSYQLRIVVPLGYDFELKDVTAVYDKVGASVLKWKRWDVDFDDFVPAEDVVFSRRGGFVRKQRAREEGVSKPHTWRPAQGQMGGAPRKRKPEKGQGRPKCARTSARGASVPTVGEGALPSQAHQEPVSRLWG